MPINEMTPADLSRHENAVAVLARVAELEQIVRDLLPHAECDHRIDDLVPCHAFRSVPVERWCIVCRLRESLNR